MSNEEARGKGYDEIMSILHASAETIDRVTGAVDVMNNKLNTLDMNIAKIGDEVGALKNDIRVTSAQMVSLRAAGADRIHKVLGDKGSHDYVTYSAVFYAHLWHDYKRRFGINSYQFTRKVDYDAGMEFIAAWKPNCGVDALKTECDNARIERAREQERLKKLAGVQS